MTKKGRDKRGAATHEKTDTRLVLINAAAELMRERHSLNITLMDIAQKSGVNGALVKYYFGSKQGLLFAVLEQHFLSFLRELDKLLASDLGPEEMMRAHIAGMARSYKTVPYLNRLLHMMSREATPERVEHIARDFVKPIAEAQAKILKAGVDQNIFREIDPTSFYFQVVGSTGSLYGQRFVLQSAFSIHKVSSKLHQKNSEQIVDILMNGILKDTSPKA